MSLMSIIYLEKHEKRDRDWLLTLCQKPGWLGRLFRRKEKTFQVLGHNTVWHYFPSFRWCPTVLESWLSEVNERLEYLEKFKELK